jgi:hypothetical protein
MEVHHDKNPHNQVKVAIVQKTDSFPPEQHFQLQTRCKQWSSPHF